MGEINWKDKCWVTTIFLVREDGKVLLTWNKNMQTWIPVGGHLEIGETPEEAVTREVEEETGLDFDFLESPVSEEEGNVRKINFQRFQIEKVPHHNHHMNFVFIGKCKSANDRTETDENEKLRWFSEDELIKNKSRFIESVWNRAIISINKVRRGL